MNKKILALTVSGLLSTAGAAQAFTLPDGATLSIDAGSQFAMGGGAYGTVPLLGQNDLRVGTALGDTGTGSHGGAPAGGDVGAVTQPWAFFGNTGYDFLSTNGSGAFTGDTTSGVDMTAWTVTWNGIANIPMGGCSLVTGGCTQGSTVFVDTGVGTFTWDGTDGGTYTITYTTHVPVGDPSNFGGVQYDLNLQGTVTFPPVLNNPPVANDDGFNLPPSTTGNVLAILTNDTDPDAGDLPDAATIDLDPGTGGQQTTVATSLGGSVSVDMAGVVTYDAPAGGVTGMDTFTYTVDDINGPDTSNTATVTITLANEAPVANDDSGIGNGFFIDTTVNTFVNLDILANDTDSSGNGTIDVGSVMIIDDVNNGTTQKQLDGTVTYMPNAGFSGNDTFIYTVADDASSPLTSNQATVTIVVSASTGTPLPAFMVLSPGQVGDVLVSPALGEGSWFSMELSPGSFTYTAVVGFDHIELGTTQPALSPNMPGMDEPWSFFGNLGVHQTTSDLGQLSNDGAGTATLDMSGWDVSWNAIPSIPLGAGPDNGVGTVTCYTDLLAQTLGTCAAGESFILSYDAIVPPGDPSGFGGVNYAVHFEGVLSATAPTVVVPTPPSTSTVEAFDTTGAGVTVAPGTLATSQGNTSGIGLTAAEVGSVDPLFNSGDGQMCIGGCIDFTITGLTQPYVDVVVYLSEALPSGAIYRKLINGTWTTFDTSGTDYIGSNADVAGACTDDVFSSGLRAGNRCLLIRIYDGGPNDADGTVNGTVVDPGGILLAGSPNVPASATDGCSVSGKPVTLAERADWMLVLLYLAVIGFISIRRKGDNI